MPRIPARRNVRSWMKPFLFRSPTFRSPERAGVVADLTATYSVEELINSVEIHEE